MGIRRSKIIEKKMKFKKTNLYLKLRRLLSPKLMGNLFKVILHISLKEMIFMDLINVLLKNLKNLKKLDIVFLKKGVTQMEFTRD